MGEILGIGAPHNPMVCWNNQRMAHGHEIVMRAPKIAPRYPDRAAWPAPLLADLGADQGLTTSRRYHAAYRRNFLKLQRVIAGFKPDFMLIVGDDQYENFTEEIIPPFCVFGLDDAVGIRPWSHGIGGKGLNEWGEPEDFVFTLRGHREAAKYITSELIECGFPMPYAYKLRHLSHAFVNPMLFLDWGRSGFSVPIVPIQVNCYGSSVLVAKGFVDHLYQDPAASGLPDPPAPRPATCWALGQMLAEVLERSPYRVVIMGSANLSHSFLASRTGYVLCDLEADRGVIEALGQDDLRYLASLPPDEIEETGMHEILNWTVLAGAMDRLGYKCMLQDYLGDNHMFLSTACWAWFGAPARLAEIKAQTA